MRGWAADTTFRLWTLARGFLSMRIDALQSRASVLTSLLTRVESSHRVVILPNVSGEDDRQHSFPPVMLLDT